MPALRRLLLPIALFSALTLVACRQGLNDRCQLNSDCQDGLTCILPGGANASVALGGTCQMPNGTVDGPTSTADLLTTPGDGGAVDATSTDDAPAAVDSAGTVDAPLGDMTVVSTPDATAPRDAAPVDSTSPADSTLPTG